MEVTADVENFALTNTVTIASSGLFRELDILAVQLVAHPQVYRQLFPGCTLAVDVVSLGVPDQRVST